MHVFQKYGSFLISFIMYSSRNKFYLDQPSLAAMNLLPTLTETRGYQSMATYPIHCGVGLSVWVTFSSFYPYLEIWVTYHEIREVQSFPYDNMSCVQVRRKLSDHRNVYRIRERFEVDTYFFIVHHLIVYTDIFLVFE